MKKVILKTTLGLAVAVASTQLFASGFALNEQSISGMGTGFAGRSSTADDASTVFGNPAGMSRLKRDEVTVGAAAIIASSDISLDGPNVPGGTTNGDMVPFVGVPMGYYVKPIDEHWAFGIGIYAPFGLMTDYENSFAGRYFGSKSTVQVVTIQPTISYAFNDKVSVGFGPTINRIDGNLQSATLSRITPGRNDGKVNVEGDDTAVGYNIGVLVQATDKTRVGLTYHSMVDYKLEGTTKITGVGSFGAASGSEFDASLKVKTPESVDFSITHELTDALTLHVGSTWTRWSRLEDITVNNEGVPAALGGSAGPIGTITEEQNWHNTWAHAIGATYKLNKEWVLRTGFSVDQSPTNNTNRSPRIPSGDRTVFSIGAGYSPTDDWTIDLAANYLKEQDVEVHDASPSKGAFNAKYENSAIGLGAGVTYRF
ncbi:OmpP1/FadL family transporter [Pseudomonas akapageensis]|uniref:OmpP1/FadL family transporter n=1 Tax=Pseudomonas akapageensis TaxID=2609961 RepID=UPI0014084E1B|nr:outer membrane protein transport protein [Pseudomonas akapageensis]